MALIFTTFIQWLSLEQPVNCIFQNFRLRDKAPLCVFMLFFESCVYSHLQEEYGAIEIIKLSLPELHKCPLNNIHC